MIVAPFGLAITDKKTPEEVAGVLGQVMRPTVIWLAFQDCTGCTETLLRTSHPDLGDLIMNVISLEYHETLMAGSGMQAQQALDEAVKKYSGNYICVVEGSIPTRDKGVYMKLAGRPAMEVLADVGGKAAAIIAIGSCGVGRYSVCRSRSHRLGRSGGSSASSDYRQFAWLSAESLHTAWSGSAICRLRHAAGNGR
jgi:NiFe hydrogenase small subunit HydA